MSMLSKWWREIQGKDLLNKVAKDYIHSMPVQVELLELLKDLPLASQARAAAQITAWADRIVDKVL